MKTHLATISRRALALGLGMCFGVLCFSAAAADDPSVLKYGQMCAQEIGEIPPFNCDDGTVVPITVDGKTPSPGQYTAGMTCDRPALLPYGAETFGQCTPYSRILNLSRGKTQISAFCRREYLREPNSPMYDEVDIVLHAQDSGKTCWFHAQSAPGDTKGFNASRVPPPNEKTPPPTQPSAEKFWWPPAPTSDKNCAGCHDAEPYMYSPWLGQKWEYVPTDPLGHYINLGEDFAKWHSSGISTRDNTCVGCHRIGNQASCSTYIPMAAGMMDATGGNNLAKSYPLNHWMPVNNDNSQAFWNVTHEKSIRDLLTCCADPKNPICTITPIITPEVKSKSH
jgi:hypothetical protein